MRAELSKRVAGVAVAGAAVLAAGIGVAPAQAQAPAAAPHASAAYSCPRTAICVHGYKYVNGHKKYSWRRYWSCVNHGPWNSWFPTYYINNQTRGTVAKFLDNRKHVIQRTPGAYSKGKVKHPSTTYYVDPC